MKAKNRGKERKRGRVRWIEGRNRERRRVKK